VTSVTPDLAGSTGRGSARPAGNSHFKQNKVRSGGG
jgi:hypothetical protein